MMRCDAMRCDGSRRGMYVRRPSIFAWACANISLWRNLNVITTKHFAFVAECHCILSGQSRKNCNNNSNNNKKTRAAVVKQKILPHHTFICYAIFKGNPCCNNFKCHMPTSVSYSLLSASSSVGTTTCRRHKERSPFAQREKKQNHIAKTDLQPCCCCFFMLFALSPHDSDYLSTFATHSHSLLITPHTTLGGWFDSMAWLSDWLTDVLRVFLPTANKVTVTRKIGTEIAKKCDRSTARSLSDCRNCGHYNHNRTK